MLAGVFCISFLFGKSTGRQQNFSHEAAAASYEKRDWQHYSHHNPSNMVLRAKEYKNQSIDGYRVDKPLENDI
jgi:hypothetical protein